MRRVVLDMQNLLFADAVAEALRRFDSDFDPVMSESPDKTVALCNATLANILIMEVTAYAPWKLEARMKIRDELRKLNPECKIVLVVDENTEKKAGRQCPSGEERRSGGQFCVWVGFFELSVGGYRCFVRGRDGKKNDSHEFGDFSKRNTTYNTGILIQNKPYRR